MRILSEQLLNPAAALQLGLILFYVVGQVLEQITTNQLYKDVVDYYIFLPTRLFLLSYLRT